MKAEWYQGKGRKRIKDLLSSCLVCFSDRAKFLPVGLLKSSFCAFGLLNSYPGEADPVLSDFNVANRVRASRRKKFSSKQG